MQFLELNRFDCSENVLLNPKHQLPNLDIECSASTFINRSSSRGCAVAILVNAFIEAVCPRSWSYRITTEHLMTLFYSELSRHDCKVDALRVAQLNLVNQGLPPYYRL
jgi:hypothetical protein